MRLIEPGHPKVTLEQGFSYIKKGELGKAISIMDTLIDNDPYLAQAYWGRALCLEHRAVNFDDVNSAISDYSRSIVYSDESAALSYGRRGILYFKTGLYEEALKDLNKALESDLLWVEARFYRGRTYLALERNESDIKKAESDFTDVIRNIEDPFAPAHFWRAQALRLLGKMKAAVADYERALEIDPDDALALNALAYCNEHGVGCKINLTRAEELYEKSAESGFLIAQKNLAWFYANKKNGGFENAERSAYWMRKAAIDGDAEAQNLYALRRLHGKGAGLDVYQAAHFFKLAAKQEYPPAICNLAECYERGTGVQKDLLRAFALYGQAAESGSELGLYNVGRCYYFGIGVEENNEKAFEILKPLADGGLARAQDIIGMCYENGYGVKKSLARSVRYFRLAYSQGHAHAAAHLAARYRAGRGVKKNLAAAARLYKEAGDRGSSYAMLALGKLYYEDRHDYGKAAEAFRSALDEGENDALFWLARSLLLGKAPETHTDEIRSLLERAIEAQSNKLMPAVFLSTLELFGFYGFPFDQHAAANRVLEFLPDDGSEPEGLSCAYVFLAQAHELGFGVEKNAQAACDLYRRAAASGRDGPGCRCFVGGLAHTLYMGVGCQKDEGAASRLIEAELRAYGGETDSSVILLHVWHEHKTNAGADTAALTSLVKQLCLDEPNDALAAYMLYFLRRNEPDAKKLLSHLNKLLETASPYHRSMIENHLKKTPGEAMYPILTPETLHGQL